MDVDEKFPSEALPFIFALVVTNVFSFGLFLVSAANLNGLALKFWCFALKETVLEAKS